MPRTSSSRRMRCSSPSILISRPRVLAEQDAVARLDVERDDLAVVVELAPADRDDLPLLGLLLRGVRDDDARRRSSAPAPRPASRSAGRPADGYGLPFSRTSLPGSVSIWPPGASKWNWFLDWRSDAGNSPGAHAGAQVRPPGRRRQEGAARFFTSKPSDQTVLDPAGEERARLGGRRVRRRDGRASRRCRRSWLPTGARPGPRARGGPSRSGRRRRRAARRGATVGAGEGSPPSLQTSCRGQALSTTSSAGIGRRRRSGQSAAAIARRSVARIGSASGASKTSTRAHSRRARSASHGGRARGRPGSEEAREVAVRGAGPTGCSDGCAARYAADDVGEALAAQRRGSLLEILASTSWRRQKYIRR